MKPEVTMKTSQEEQRQQAKTVSGLFRSELGTGYGIHPRIAEAIASMAEELYAGQGQGLQAGQQRVVLVKRRERHGQPLEQSGRLLVHWTVDNGAEDQQVRAQHGSAVQRQVRIQRLLDEALEQGALATQEDLAQALQVSKRTIQRDLAALSAQGVFLATRGYLQGIGRGQTHKGQIIRLWLQGQTYDQLVLATHHCAASIERYVHTFLQVVRLERAGYRLDEIQLVLGMGQPLIAEYLSIAAHSDQPGARARLEDELARTAQRTAGKKGGR